MVETVRSVAVVLMTLTVWPFGLPHVLGEFVAAAPVVVLLPLPDQPAPGPSDINVVPDPSPVPPEPPVTSGVDAQDDRVAVTIGVPANISYLENDVYDGAVAASVTQDPQHGTVTSPQPEAFVYTATQSVATTDSFVYQLCSVDTGACDQATVTIEIVSTGRMVPEKTGKGVVAEPPGPTAPSTCQAPLQWGGHSNGRIPGDALQPIGAGQRLMREAAEAFIAMRDAAAADGVTIGITDSYRSFEAQVAVRAAKGGVVATATPGTSVHGWGKALDLKVQDSQVRRWLEQHSRAYAWINPPWAKRPGKSFEPWHYEYYGVGVDAEDPQCAGIGNALTGASGEIGANEGASEGASETANGALPMLPASLNVPGGSIGLGLGALLSSVCAGLIVFRDLQRTREIKVVSRP